MSENIPNISDGLWEDLKQILEYMVIKNNQLAEAYETDETKHNATLYFSAIHHSGPILLYSDYYTFDLLDSVMTQESDGFIEECLKDPSLIPSQYRSAIIHKVEQEAISHFEEKNNYYRMLIGLPPYGTPVSGYLFLQDTTYHEFDIQKQTFEDGYRYPAIHELDTVSQSYIQRTDDFRNILKEHTNDDWLHYLGEDKIPLEQARSAKEFEIIRLFPNMDPNINRSLCEHFSNEYNRARSWVAKVMWNVDLEQTSISYRQFVGFAILIKALRLTLNRQFDGIIENSFLNDAMVTILFDLYRLPQSLNNLPKENRRRLALELRKLIRDRGSNKVLYDIARILGFDNIIISKIVLNKIQLFEGENQKVVHERLTGVRNPLTGTPTQVDDPYHSYLRQMQAIDILSPNPHDDIVHQRHIKDYVREVTDPDPRWWEDNNPADKSGLYPSSEEGFLRNDADEIKKKEFNPSMFKEQTFGNPNRDLPTSDKDDPNYDEVYWSVNEETRRHPSWYLPGYNSVDTKYLMLTYHYSMAEKTFESLYLMRYLLDKKKETETYQLLLPTYGGKDLHSIYDIVLFLTCGLNRLLFAPFGPPDDYRNNPHGRILQNEDGFRRIVGYNVDIPGKELNEYLDRCTYLDAGTIRSYIEETQLTKQSDIPSAYAVGILGLRDYLITKLELADTITEWREANTFYHMMFTYDPIRDIHKKEEATSNPDEEEYHVPAIRYKIFDMEVSKFGDATGQVGDPVSIVIQTFLNSQAELHPVTVGFVSKVEDGIITEVNFRYPEEIDDFHALPVWNNPNYNAKSDINLLSDQDMDLGDQNNPSGSNGPSIEEGSYPATIGNARSSSGMYIRVTTIRQHTANLYDTYLDELTERDPWLAQYIQGTYDDREMALRLDEACDVLSEAIDTDLNFIRSDIHGGEDMERYLMDMIKYIKSYMIDFITSEKAIVLNDKKNPEWLRLIDGIESDPRKPSTMTASSPLMIYDAIRTLESFSTVSDGKYLPKDEWDQDPFTHGRNHLQDSIRVYNEEDRPNIQYKYTIQQLVIQTIQLPSGLKRGEALTDSFLLENYSDHPPIELSLEFYLGTNPNPGEGTEFYYHDSGFRYKVSELAMEDIPILICIQHNQLPEVLPVDVIPKYGLIHDSENGYLTGKIECDCTRRRDLDHPQHKS